MGNPNLDQQLFSGLGLAIGLPYARAITYGVINRRSKSMLALVNRKAEVLWITQLANINPQPIFHTCMAAAQAAMGGSER